MLIIIYLATILFAPRLGMAILLYYSDHTYLAIIALLWLLVPSADTKSDTQED